jgi:3-oxoacyl-(acyl-carrier-protein) synthase
VRKALMQARRHPDEVDVIAPHLTGTVQGDIHDIAWVKKEFYGPGSRPITADEQARGVIKRLVYGAKANTGHDYAASAIQTMILMGETQRQGGILPTANQDELSPECQGVNWGNGQHIKGNIDVVLVGGVGVGGPNGQILIERDS